MQPLVEVGLQRMVVSHALLLHECLDGGVGIPLLPVVLVAADVQVGIGE